MRIVLQRVKQANVKIENQIVGQIAHGFVLLLGITHDDRQINADTLIEKVLKLRLFSDQGSKSFMEKNIQEVGGEILVASQFTLYGNCKKGTKPSFTEAAQPDYAQELYNYFVDKLKENGVRVQTGIFGKQMDVELVNNGPITLILE